MFLHDDTLHKLDGLHASWTFLVLQQQQNLGRRFGTSKMHLSPPVCLGCCPFSGGGSVVVDFLFIVTPIVRVVRYFMSILVLQSS